MASIHSQEEMDYIIAEFLTDKPPYVWIGGKRVDDTWTWTDGTPWDYDNWAKKEPNNNKGKEDVAVIKERDDNQWNDIQSKTKCEFLCKI